MADNPSRRSVRKRSFKKRKGKKRAQNTKAVANRALALAEMLAAQREVKFFDDTISRTMNTSGHTDYVCQIAQDDTSGTRDGRQVMPTHLRIHLSLARNGSAVHDGEAVRIIVVQSKEDTIPTPAVFLNSVDYLSFRNLNYQEDFDVLMDETFIVDATFPLHDIRRSFKLKYPILFEIGDTTGAGVAAGPVNIISIGSTSTTPAALEGITRLRYTDS